MPKTTFKDMGGERFGRLTVLDMSHRTAFKHIVWRCACDCGKETAVAGGHLRSGHTTSCGCANVDAMKGNARNPKRLGEMTGVKIMLCHFRYGAKKRDIPFALSVENVAFLIAQPCAYCAKPPAQILKIKHYHHFVYTGIDRVDNSLGYTVENCVPCCGTCNKAKSDMGLDAYRSFIERSFANLSRWPIPAKLDVAA